MGVYGAFAGLAVKDLVAAQRRAPVIAAIPVALIVGLSSCASPPQRQSSTPPTPTASTESWIMPDLVGSNLQSAQDQIQRLTHYGIAITFSHDATGGGRHQIVDTNWKVCSQNVAPGSTIDRSTRIDFGAVKLDERCP